MRILMRGWIWAGLALAITLGCGGGVATAAGVARDLGWAQFLGGDKNDGCYGMALDSRGNVILAGSTNSTTGLTSGGSDDKTYNGGDSDAFVAKLSPTGQVLWFTYLGGSGTDYANGITVSADDYIFVVGTTNSTDFPTMNAWDISYNGGGSDAFVALYGPSGGLIRAGFIGGAGAEEGYAIAQKAGNVYITGYTNSKDFPPTNGADPYPNGNMDAFVTCLDTSLHMVWSTYLGGQDASDQYNEVGLGITVAPGGAVYVTGQTCAPDFASAGATDKTLDGPADAFLAKFKSGGTLEWARYYGGPGADQGNFVAAAWTGEIYVTGQTSSASGITVTTGGYDHVLDGTADGFLARFDASGNLVWGTYLGGWANEEMGLGLATDLVGNCYVSGYTNSLDFPQMNPLSAGYCWSLDMFVMEFNPAGGLCWSTLLGGNANDYGYCLAADYDGRLLLGGYSDSTQDFPSPMGQTMAGQHGGYDLYVAQLDPKNGADRGWLTME